MKLKIFTDGASRGNPGKASYGYIITDEKNRLVHKSGKAIGVATNNVAEYTALLEAFIYLKKLKLKPDLIEVFADSKLLIEQMRGNFKIKNPNLIILARKVRENMESLGSVSYTHVPREQNKIADSLANEALDILRDV